MQLIGGFIFVCALVVFWHIIVEVRDWWRSMREMERLEKEIDAENANAERHARSLLDNATSNGRETDEASSMGSSPRGRAAPLAPLAESLPQRPSMPAPPAR